MFDDPVGRTYHLVLKKIKGKLYKKRWGSVAFHVAQILSLEFLRRRWSLLRYNQGRQHVAARPADSDEENEATRIETVNNAIQSCRFWCGLVTLKHVYDVVLWCFGRFESCICHYHLPKRDDLPPFLRAPWEGCPMRGFILPLISSGLFFEELGREFDYSVVKLLEALPSDATPALRSGAVQEFERGRASFMFQMVLKQGPMQNPPQLLVAAAYPERAVAVPALRTCLQ